MGGTKPIIINKIKKLSQEEGLKDSEIADIINYNRVSVARIRKEHGIPSYNINNRKDKKAVCPQCKSEYFVRRCEKPGICCPDCAKKINRKLNRKFRIMKQG